MHQMTDSFLFSKSHTTKRCTSPRCSLDAPVSRARMGVEHVEIYFRRHASPAVYSRAGKSLYRVAGFCIIGYSSDITGKSCVCGASMRTRFLVLEVSGACLP